MSLSKLDPATEELSRCAIRLAQALGSVLLAVGAINDGPTTDALLLTAADEWLSERSAQADEWWPGP